MSSLLQRLGSFAVRRRRLVVGLWIGALIALAAGSSLAGGKFISGFSLPGTPSQDAIDLLDEKLPAANGGSGRIVFAADEGAKLTAEQQRAITATLGEVADTDGVAAVSDPFATKAVSQDGRIAFAQVTFSEQPADIEAATQEAVSEAGAAAEKAGVQVALSGDAAPVEQEGHTAEALGFAVALVVLAITFGSLLAAGLPLLTAVVGLGFGVLGVTLVAAFTDLNDTTTALASMLGIAVGIDYALFIISRHRTQVQSGMPIEASIAHAIGTAGSAVVFAGATVIIALCALVVCGVPFLTTMGLGAAATVAFAVLVNVTFVPALLAIAGARAVAGKRPLAGFDAATGAGDTLGGRWVRLVTRHRAIALALTVVGTLALAVPALDLRLGLPDDSSAPASSTKRESYELLKAGFGPGFSGPLTVVADLDAAQDKQAAADAVAKRVGGMDDIATVAAPVISPDKSVAIIGVTPASGPSTEATEDLVRAIRAQDQATFEDTGAHVLVTGQTAINIDIAKKMSDSLIPYLAVVVVLALLLLMVAFRSVLVPITAIAGFLLTIAASLGALVAVFQNGFAAELLGVSAEAPIVSLIPTLMIGILFGLAMDYQMFLVSGMREERTHGADPQTAVTSGFRHSARVVTAAALIMISVFSGFIIPSDPIIKSIGFALAFGILIDAFVVRMTLIPAVMSLLGERAWWLPKWLDRLLPDVDIEGAKLERPTPSPQPTKQPDPALLPA